MVNRSSDPNPRRSGRARRRPSASDRRCVHTRTTPTAWRRLQTQADPRSNLYASLLRQGADVRVSGGSAPVQDSANSRASNRSKPTRTSPNGSPVRGGSMPELPPMWALRDDEVAVPGRQMGVSDEGHCLSRLCGRRGFTMPRTRSRRMCLVAGCGPRCEGSARPGRNRFGGGPGRQEVAVGEPGPHRCGGAQCPVDLGGSVQLGQHSCVGHLRPDPPGTKGCGYAALAPTVRPGRCTHGRYPGRPIGGHHGSAGLPSAFSPNFAIL